MPEYDDRFETLETNLVHAGAPRPNIGGAVVTPIFQSANYLMADEGAYDEVRYIRLGNSPNHLALQARLAVAESGEAALVTASGMAAITTSLLAFVGAGDHVLAQRTLYGGSQSFLDEDAPRFGIAHTAIDTLAGDRASWEAALRPETRLVLVESISNPLIEVGDLEAVVAFAKDHGLITVIDNTFASPVNFRPLEIGIDLVVHSATKYLNGHSDIVAGAVIGSAEKVDRVRQLLLHLGGSIDPNTAFLFERGMKTLALRVARQNANAQALAEHLAGRGDIARVNYPGLPDDPGHANASKLFSGFGGMLSFYAGDDARGESLLTNLRIPLHAASLGGVETLVVRPARSSHLGLSPEQRQRLGITDDLIRVSVGIEDPAELIADFDQALS
jgi:cystathionine gamma-synthase/cystathionine gamma-lyase/cystathionine beta-lyase